MRPDPVPATGGRWGWLFAIGLASLAPLTLFAPMILSRRVLYWGTPLLQFGPWHSLALEMIRHGTLPLWNPQLGMGAPLLANHQSALLYPPNWLLAAVDIAQGQTFLVFAHLLFAGAGMVFLLRHLGRSLLAQTVGAIAFSSSSYIVARSGFLSLNAACAWLPWLVLCADHLGTAAARQGARASIGPVLATSGVIALQTLAGHAQTLVYSLIFALAWSLWRGVTLDAKRAPWKVLLLWAAAGALGTGVAGAQLGPTLEYYLQSSRSSGLDETAALTYSFWPWRTLGLVIPGVFGNPALGDFWGYGNYWEDALYIGILPLMMAIVGAGWGGRVGKAVGSLRTFLLVSAGVAFFFALGQNTPAFPYLFKSMPVFGAFNAPTRWNLITTFCLAMLAAIGAELWRRPTGRTLYWTRLGTAGAAAAIAVGIAAAVVPSGLHASFGRSFALAGLWVLLAGAITLAWRDAVPRAWIALVAVVISADLVVANYGLNPTAPAALYHGTTSLAQSLGDGHRVFLLPEAERILKFERTHRSDSFQTELDPRWIRESGLPNTPLLDGLASANNFDPLVPARYGQWLERVARLSGAHLTDVLSAADVGWMAARIGDVAPWVSYEPVADPVRVRLVPRALAASSAEDAMDLAMAPAFDERATVALEGAESQIDRVGGPGEVRIADDPDPLRVTIEVKAPQGGWVVLSDTWFPGWTVRVDGAPASGYAADGIFRAVWTPPGEHRVVWSYEPLSARLGALASGVGLVLLLALGVWWAAQRRSA